MAGLDKGGLVDFIGQSGDCAGFGVDNSKCEFLQFSVVHVEYLLGKFNRTCPRTVCRIEGSGNSGGYATSLKYNRVW